MNAIPSELVGFENNTEVVHETEDSLVEMGSVATDTRGNPLGASIDNGGAGWTFG